ncbi:hypothetical protein [Faecalibacillus faecis]|uniref:hypothetical protein n=1 Tax=Faecalibacillus faecis TaxID=1982628 RepID=UPI000E50A678|nr:hypothetical protein [Faecalibacillus faecis]RHH10898.1 hypothetical protein DW226_05795 [Coprobacillus sp. AM18-4LB-d2]
MERYIKEKKGKTIILNFPEKKEYLIQVADKNYKIKSGFSVNVYRQLIEDIDKENWKEIIARILQSEISSEISKVEGSSPSINEILSDSTEPCKKYIKILLEQDIKLKEFYGEDIEDNDEYEKFKNAVEKYHEYTHENINKKLMAFTNSFNEQMKKYDFSSVFTELNNVFSGIREQIRDSLTEFKNLLPEFDWDDWDEGVKHWGEYGWTMIPNAPIGLFKTKISDESERDKIALQYLRKKDMDDLFKELQKMRLNHSDLNEAIYCYNNRCYKACAMILCSIIDGIIYKRQPVKKRNRRKGDRKFFEKIKESGLKKELLQQSIFLLQIDNLIAYLNKLFENGKDFQLDTNVLNRNFLLHGMSKRRVRQKDCKQLFLAVYNTKLVIEGLDGRLKNNNIHIMQILEN